MPHGKVLFCHVSYTITTCKMDDVDVFQDQIKIILNIGICCQVTIHQLLLGWPNYLHGKIANDNTYTISQRMKPYIYIYIYILYVSISSFNHFKKNHQK